MHYPSLRLWYSKQAVKRVRISSWLFICLLDAINALRCTPVVDVVGGAVANVSSKYNIGHGELVVGRPRKVTQEYRNAYLPVWSNNGLNWFKPSASHRLLWVPTRPVIANRGRQHIRCDQEGHNLRSHWLGFAATLRSENICFKNQPNPRFSTTWACKMPRRATLASYQRHLSATRRPMSTTSTALTWRARMGSSAPYSTGLLLTTTCFPPWNIIATLNEIFHILTHNHCSSGPREEKPPSHWERVSAVRWRQLQTLRN